MIGLFQMGLPMDLHRLGDCVVGFGCGALGLWVDQHWLTVLGAALLVWRSVQAFILEPMGIFWPRPRARRRR